MILSPIAGFTASATASTPPPVHEGGFIPWYGRFVRYLLSGATLQADARCGFVEKHKKQIVAMVMAPKIL